MARRLARVVDLRGHREIIGSKILKFWFEPIPNRKTVQFLHIKTDTVDLRIKTKMGNLEKCVNSPFLTKDEKENE